MRGLGRVFQRRGSSKWWIAYSVDGQEHRESGGNTEAEANRKLKARLREIHRDEFVKPSEGRLTVDALLDALETHMANRGAKSLKTLRSHLKPVRAFFGLLPARSVTGALLERYIKARLAAGMAAATVNRELQPIKRAFTLALQNGRITKVPYVSLLTEDNARQGFFESDEFNRVVGNLPDPIAQVAWFAYLSGWRKGEILPLKWDAVDRQAREIRLATSKNGHGRVLPLEGALWALIEHRWAERQFIGEDGSLGLSEYVFHRRGVPVVDFKRSWASACRAAAVPGKLFHDLRRTAVRNMIRAGVDQAVAMSISGHRTVSMFLRYNIASDVEKREALRKTQSHLKAGGN